MIVDLHTHTQEYSDCSGLPVEELIRQAMAIGLDGVAITDHSRIGGGRAGQKLGAEYGFPVFRGVEVHTDLGDILVFGLYRDFPMFMDGRGLLRMIAEAGGAAVLAHPFRPAAYSLGDALRRAVVPIAEAPAWCPELRMLAAVEVWNDHCPEGEIGQARRLAQALELPSVGGSDAHYAHDVGSAATAFPDRIASDEELIEALRAGGCSPTRVRWRP